MPRYFFNTRIGDELIVDPDGEDLRNPDRAWEVARQMILEVVKSEGTQRALLEAVIEVTDADGTLVGTGGVDLDIADRNVLSASVTITGDGEYHVTWSAGSIDGHLGSGEFAFRVGPEPTRDVADTALPASFDARADEARPDVAGGGRPHRMRESEPPRDVQ